MEFFKSYAGYWPVFFGTALFLIFGFWWHKTAQDAAELIPKPLDWVRTYRSGAYPFRSEVLGGPVLSRTVWIALLSALVLAVFSLSMIGRLLGQPAALRLSSRYGLFFVFLRVAGAAAVFFLLQSLLRSTWAAFPGTLLFAASSVRGHNDACFLAVSLLLLTLYLRAEAPCLRSELFYLAACLTASALLALRPGLIWLPLCFPALHWYKLIRMLRAGRLSGRNLGYFAAAAAVTWALTLLLTLLLHGFLLVGFQPMTLIHLLKRSIFSSFYHNWSDLLCNAAFRTPSRGMLVELLLDAPLLGLGFWGFFSAWRLGVRRRNGGGILILIILAVLMLVWLLTGVYLLSFGLTLAAACIFREADLSGKRWICIAASAASVCWYLLIQYAASAAPLTAGLLERIR